MNEQYIGRVSVVAVPGPVHQTRQSISAPLRRGTLVFIFLNMQKCPYLSFTDFGTFGKPGQTQILGFALEPSIIALDRS